MGIDMYLRWQGQTDDERKAQYTGYRVDHGHVGYLREAYHGGPYATRALAPEAFEDTDGSCDDQGYDIGIRIPASTLRSRLEAVCDMVLLRAAKVYGETLTLDSPEVRAFIDFVEMYERLEREGKEPHVSASY